MAEDHELTRSAVRNAVAAYRDHRRNGRDHGQAMQAIRVALGHSLAAEGWESLEEYLRKTAAPDAEAAVAVVLKDLFNLDPG